MKLTELKREVGFSVTALVYSRPKIGKSFFAATAAITDRVVLVCTLNGIDTYMGKDIKTKYQDYKPENIEVKLLERDSNISNATGWDRLNDIMRDLFEKNLDTFDTLILDDSSFLNEQAKNYAVRFNGNMGRSESMVKAMKDVKSSFSPQTVMTESDYLVEMTAVYKFLEELVLTCKKYGKNLIVLAHEARIYIKKKNDRGQEASVLTDITAAYTGKKEADRNSGHFDLVFRLTVKGKEASREIRFQCKSGEDPGTGANVDAGNRYGVFNHYEANLNWPECMKRIKQQLLAVETPKPSKEDKATTLPAVSK
jgi:hypothetical protein